ncbi:expressed protein [Chlorella variabilis]|uniref:Expressed protein n=1 Tax=Chlorella variabilis TaxID=554065 RepID=E1ZH05_CHLVA|nr:expressed protein [Chlorella variabilis]EFN54842.1 expressed protein [Chlorella variabilis]|eukprot:XP_005846944.1 expressed protein [Chlorella variabilis]
MDPFFDDTVVRDLVEATAGALDAGADPAAVYGLVSETCTQCVDYMSQELHNTLMQRMHPDTLIDRFNGKTVLHELLGRTHPPALVAGLDWEGVPQTTLEEVLDRHERLGPDPHLDRPPSNRASAGTDMAWAAGATPDLRDAEGNTALHLVVVNACRDEQGYFPDLAPHLAFHVRKLQDLYRDEERVDYLEGAGTALLRRGWSLDLPNRDGLTVRQALAEAQGLARSKRVRWQRLAAEQRPVGPGAASDMHQGAQHLLQQADRMERVLLQLANLGGN